MRGGRVTCPLKFFIRKMLSQKFQTLDSSAGTTVTLQDITGDYSSENTGGYGSPNEERTSLALYVVATHELSNGAVSLTLSGYLPETADEWVVTGLDPLVNQWIKFKIFNVPLQSLVVAPSEGDVSHEESSDELQIYTSGSWVTVAPSEIDATLNASSLEYSIKNHGKPSGFYKVYNRLTKLIYTDCNCSTSDLRKMRMEVLEKLEGFQLLMCEGNYELAQKMAENFEPRIRELIKVD